MKTLVIAPHPDDEILGCGGLLLNRKLNRSIVGWVIMTSSSHLANVNENWSDIRTKQIEDVRCGLSIEKKHLYELNYPTTRLDQVPLNDLIQSLSDVINNFEPVELILPHPGDIHSDHFITFKAALACSKWFRYSSIKRILTYETLSETNFQLCQPYAPFAPNLYVDISSTLEDKVKLLSFYTTEISDHPFPRSIDSVRALAKLRGTQRGVLYAEAFQILRSFE